MSHKKKILIVDDDNQNIKVAANALRSNDLTFGFAQSGAEALKRVCESSFDMILLDVMMPGMDGFEVCEKLKSTPETKDIPVIFLTAKTDSDSIERAYSVGGADYVSKPFKSRELNARVWCQLRQRELVQQLEQLARCDTLTGVNNRRRFFELAEQQCANPNVTHAALMIDVDHFKGINDSYGHAVGDQALKMIAQVIQSTIPNDANIGRLGGEEFAVLLQVEVAEDATKSAEAIRMAVAATDISLLDKSAGINCTISIGVGLESGACSIDELLKSADEMLYRAKDKGRNRVDFRSNKLT